MNIIELAKEAGLPCQHPDWIEGYERFAAIVREEREWVDLTDDEIINVISAQPHAATYAEIGQAVIAAFKEKNKWGFYLFYSYGAYLLLCFGIQLLKGLRNE